MNTAAERKQEFAELVAQLTGEQINALLEYTVSILTKKTKQTQ